LFTALVLAAGVASAVAQAPAPQPSGNQSPNFSVPQVGQNLTPFGGNPGIHELTQHPYLYEAFPNQWGANGFAWREPAPEEMGLSKQAEELTRELASATSDSKRSEIRTKLGEVLTKQFDARQKRHHQEIDALEAKVAKLKELVNKRQVSREEIVARRLDQVVRDSQGLGW